MKAKAAQFLFDLHRNGLRAVALVGFALQGFAQDVDQRVPAIAACESPTHAGLFRAAMTVNKNGRPTLAEPIIEFLAHERRAPFCIA